MDRWVGRTAVVTGASAGIGATLVVELAQAGVNVVGLARRSEKIDNLRSQVKNGKGKIFSVKCDVSKPEEIIKAFDYVKKTLGGVDILVNNAGVLRSGSIIHQDAEDVRAMLDTNVLGLISCTKEAIKSMDERNYSGHIVNINSIAGHSIPNTDIEIGAYISSKWAVTASTNLMRNQLAHRKSKNNIKMTSLSPGLVKTEIFEAGGLGSFNELFSNMVVLSSADVCDAIMYVLGTPPHVDITELTVRPVGELF